MSGSADDLDRFIDAASEAYGAKIPWKVLAYVAQLTPPGSHQRLVFDQAVTESLGSSNPEAAEKMATLQAAARALDEDETGQATKQDIELVSKVVQTLALEDGTVPIKVLGRIPSLMTPGSPRRRVVEQVLEGLVRDSLGDEAAERVAANHRQINALQPVREVLETRVAAEAVAESKRAAASEQSEVIARGVVRGGLKLALILGLIYVAWRFLL